MRHWMCIPALAMTALAATAAGAADRPLTGPAPGWVQPAAVTPSPASGTDAALLVLLNDQQVRLEPDAVEHYSDSRVRIQTPQGLQAMGTIGMAWQPDNDVVTVHRLIVRRGTEVRDLLGNGQDFTILRREDMLEQATLTGTLTAILQPTDLQVGDIVEFAYTHRHADPVVPDKPSLLFAWANSPVQTARFRAQWPRQMGVRWQTRDFTPEMQESSSGGTQSISFTLENPPPLLQPVGAPIRFTALRRLELTTFESWPEVSRRLAPLYVDAARLAADSPLHAEVERIRATSEEPKARAAAALRLVQDNVRYVLLAMNEGALMPATADETWQRRYGDCKAKTALLLALLRELGIDAEPVAVHTVIGTGVDSQLPGISAFDHVLVRAQIDGKDYWLDGTRMGDRQLEQIQVPAFGWGLPLTANGSELVRIEPTPLSKPYYFQIISLDASGGIDKPARFVANATFRGDAAFSTKLAMDNADATQRDQGMRSFWRNRFDDLQLTRVESRFDDETGALTWIAEGTLLMDWSDGGFFELGEMQLGFRADFSRPEGTDAEAPFAVSFPDYYAYEAMVRLPAEHDFSVSGENIYQTLAGREYRRTARLAGQIFFAQASSRSLVAEISAAEARAAENDLRELYKNRLFIQKSRRPPSEAELQSQSGTPLATADEYNDRADDMVDRSMFEPALAEYTSALKLEPDNILAYSGRGNAYFNLERFGEARADLQRALELDPEDDYALGILGAVALSEGKHREAIDLLSSSIELDDTNWKRGYRADAYLEARDVSRAAQDMLAMYRMDPKPTPIFLAWASSLAGEQRIDDVLFLARAILEGIADPTAAAVIAAGMYRLAGNEELERQTLENAVRKTPTLTLYMTLATQEKDPDKAIEVLEEALELYPGSDPVLTALNARHLAKGNFPAALDAIDRLEAARGSSIYVHQMRATTYARMGDAERASDSFAAVRALARTSSEFNTLCWEQATRKVGLEDALKDCDKAVELKPDCGACLDSRAFVLLQMGRNTEAVASYDRALALEPQEAMSLYGRGIAKLRLNLESEGEADIAAAIAISSTVESTFSSYGVTR